MTKTEVELRRDYMKRAKQDPAKFLSGVNNPAVEYNYAVKVLVHNGVIDPYSKKTRRTGRTAALSARYPKARTR
jgi:hypothetical protein